MWENEKIHAVADVRLFLGYEPETGHLYWLTRVAGVRYGGGLVSARAARNFNSWRAGERAERWNAQGYGRVRLFYSDFNASRLAWALSHSAWPPGFVDHVDGNPSNNAIRNLRIVSHRENCMNRKLRVDSPTSCVGVRERHGKWEARICVSGKVLSLGRFHAFADAVAARKRAESLYGFHPNTGRVT